MKISTAFDVVQPYSKTFANQKNIKSSNLTKHLSNLSSRFSSMPVSDSEIVYDLLYVTSKYDKEYVNQLYKSENIPSYPNQEVVQQIKALKGSQGEVLEQSKNIFLNELGFPSDALELYLRPKSAMGADTMVYNILFPVISVNAGLVEGKRTVVPLLRHEIDHFARIASLCKTLGLDEIKKMILQRSPRAPLMLLDNFYWNYITYFAKKMEEQEAIKFAKSFVEYSHPTSRTYGRYKYLSNDDEACAFDIQTSLIKDLGTYNSKTMDTAMASRICVKIKALIDRIKQSDKTFDERKVLSELMYKTQVKLYKLGHKFSESRQYMHVLFDLENGNYKL